MTALIPQVQGGDRNFNQYQSGLQKTLQPILSNPINFGTLLTSIPLLAAGPNTVNTGLNRKLIGWFIVRQRAQSSIWDSQDSNTQPNQSLILNVSADVTCDIWVF